MDWSSLSVWWYYVWRSHYWWLGQEALQNIPRRIHETRTGESILTNYVLVYFHCNSGVVLCTYIVRTYTCIYSPVWPSSSVENQKVLGSNPDWILFSLSTNFTPLSLSLVCMLTIFIFYCVCSLTMSWCMPLDSQHLQTRTLLVIVPTSTKTYHQRALTSMASTPMPRLDSWHKHQRICSALSLRCSPETHQEPVQLAPAGKRRLVS